MSVYLFLGNHALAVRTFDDHRRNDITRWDESSV